MYGNCIAIQVLKNSQLGELCTLYMHIKPQACENQFFFKGAI